MLIDSNFLFRIDFNPDYDYTDYEKGICQTYYFHGKINFSSVFSAMISYSKKKSHIFSAYDDDAPHFSVSNLKEITESDIGKLQIIEAPQEFDSFKFINWDLHSVDNIQKTLDYDCTCETEITYLGNEDIEIYFEIKLCGITNNIKNSYFHNQLITDSYVKYLNTDYRMAFFLMYSAFECFINQQLGKLEDRKRLKDKINELFKTKFPKLNNNKIYSSVKDMEKYKTLRDDIAHGKGLLSIDKDIIDNLYLDLLLLIISFSCNKHTLDEVNELFFQ